MSTLESRGYVRRSGGGDRYELGLRLFELGNRSVSRPSIRSEALPVLRELAAATDQTVHIGILDGSEGVYLAKVESSRPIWLHSWEGKRIPLSLERMVRDGRMTRICCGTNQTQNLVISRDFINILYFIVIKGV